MPKTVYIDDDGNEQLIEATPEQIKEWQDKATKAAELEKVLAEKEAEVQKLASKDLNFSRFREKTEQEQNEFREKLTAEQKMVFDEVITLRQERDSEREKILKSAEERILRALVGDNEEAKKSILARAKEFAGTPKTPDELERRYRNAYILEQGSKPTVRPLFNYAPSLGSDDPDIEPKDFIETEKGKQAYKTLFGHLPGEKF